MCSSRKREMFSRAGKPLPWFSLAGAVDLLETVALHQNCCSCSLEMGVGGEAGLSAVSQPDMLCLTSLCTFSPFSALFSHLLAHVCGVKHPQERGHIPSPVRVGRAGSQAVCGSWGGAGSLPRTRVGRNSREGKGRAAGSGSCEAHKWNEAQPCDVPAFLVMFDQHSWPRLGRGASQPCTALSLCCLNAVGWGRSII